MLLLLLLLRVESATDESIHLSLCLVREPVDIRHVLVTTCCLLRVVRATLRNLARVILLADPAVDATLNVAAGVHCVGCMQRELGLVPGANVDSERLLTTAARGDGTRARYDGL